MPKAPAQQPGKGRPWTAQAPAQAAGRKLIHDGRILGTVHEWNGSWGWIVPLQKISHPQFRSNKLYCHAKDLKVVGGSLIPGSTVDFLLYADSRGLGAGDVRELEPGAESSSGLGVADAAEAEDELLPEGWEKMWSDEHGEYYYWNKSTKESSWVPPEMPDAPDEAEDDDLPEGWSRNFDPDQNEYYYWHAATKTTTWERPRVPRKEAAPAAGEEEPAEEDAEPEAEAEADGPVLGQTRAKGRVEKWQGFFGWIAPLEDLGEDLKPLLELRQDRIYCNWRDVREGTTLEAGTLVDFLLYADDNGLAAADVRLEEDAEKEDAEKAKAEKAAPAKPARGRKRPAAPKDAMAELERQWAEQDRKLGVDKENAAEARAAAEPSHGVAELQEMEDAPLLPGWEQHWSEEHSCFYYWHKVAKQASWERPCMPGATEKKEEKLWEGEGKVEGAAKLATPITPVASWAGKEITPLTPATAADKEAARLATGAGKQQPSAAFRAAQASGMFLGRGWRADQAAGKGAAQQAPPRPLPKPAALLKRPGGPAPKGSVGGKGGKGGAWPAAPAYPTVAKRPRVQ